MNSNFVFAFIILTTCTVNSAKAVQLNCVFSTAQCYNYTSNNWQDCSNCQIKDIDLSNVHTPVTSNSKETLQDNEVERLEITQSTLKFIPSVIYEIFPKMVFLYVQSNEGLASVKKEFFRNAGKLIQFWAWGNIISSVDANVFQDAPNLQVLGLQSNSIIAVDKDAFKGLRKLEVLYMFNNMLKTLHRDTFKDNLLLREISLGSNKIKILSFSTFSHLSKTTTLKLDGNVCIDKIFNSIDDELKNQLVANCGGSEGNEREKSVESELEESHLENRKLRVQLFQLKVNYRNLEKFCKTQLTGFQKFEKENCPTM